MKLPVLPNWFPFNDMLLDGHLRIGKYCVKTRNWNWGYRGQVLLYNSLRTSHPSLSAYGYRDAENRHRIIIGVATLVGVRPLDNWEITTMICNFNNLTPRQIGEGSGVVKIYPHDFGFFFQDLRRFETPVPFTWPPGPVKPINHEIKHGSPLHRQLKKARAVAAKAA